MSLDIGPEWSTPAETVPRLTKRELFAAMAMQGILSSWPENTRLIPEKTASTSIAFADSLLAELAKESP